MSSMQEHKGYVEHIIYRNEENTYTVFEVQCEDGLLTCTRAVSWRGKPCTTLCTEISLRSVSTG